PITLRDLLSMRMGLGFILADPATTPIAARMNALQLAPGPHLFGKDADTYMARLGSKRGILVGGVVEKGALRSLLENDWHWIVHVLFYVGITERSRCPSSATLRSAPTILNALDASMTWFSAF
ncbi:hypothetical protein HUK65_18020, partial [Rhodobacteraceae bacterium 2376]